METKIISVIVEYLIKSTVSAVGKNFGKDIYADLKKKLSAIWSKHGNKKIKQALEALELNPSSKRKRQVFEHELKSANIAKDDYQGVEGVLEVLRKVVDELPSHTTNITSIDNSIEKKGSNDVSVNGDNNKIIIGGAPDGADLQRKSDLSQKSKSSIFGWMVVFVIVLVLIIVNYFFGVQYFSPQTINEKLIIVLACIIFHVVGVVLIFGIAKLVIATIKGLKK